MDHKGVAYQLVQSLSPEGWRWTVELEDGRRKTGVVMSRAMAIQHAINVIDKAIKIPALKE
jgi:hypothetical protein